MMTDLDETRELFQQLRPGDRVEVEHQVTVGRRSWTTKTTGVLVATDRVRHGLHFRRNFDDKVFSDVVVLEMPDGERKWLTLDEFTRIRRA
jgi:ribosomal protein L19